jgi:hypothetical protein
MRQTKTLDLNNGTRIIGIQTEIAKKEAEGTDRKITVAAEPKFHTLKVYSLS